MVWQINSINGRPIYFLANTIEEASRIIHNNLDFFYKPDITSLSRYAGDYALGEVYAERKNRFGDMSLKPIPNKENLALTQFSQQN